MKFKDLLNEKEANWNTVKFAKIKKLIDKIYDIKLNNKNDKNLDYHIDNLKNALYGSASSDVSKIKSELEKLKQFSDLKNKIPMLKG